MALVTASLTAVLISAISGSVGLSCTAKAAMATRANASFCGSAEKVSSI